MQKLGHCILVASSLLATCGLLSSCSQVNVLNPQTNLELAPAPYFDNTTGIYFPGALGPLFRRPVVKLEERSPGLGIAVRYQNKETRIDVFVYDLQASIIPTGTDSHVINKSFEDAIADLKLAATKRIYSQLEIADPKHKSLAQTSFIHTSFNYTEGLSPKQGELFVAGINSQILKIRTSKRLGSSIDTTRLLAYLGHAIEQSRRNGYGGVSTADYERISKQLALIDLSNGLSENEAISIAQIELVKNKQHNRYDATSASAQSSDLPESMTISFSQRPTTPARFTPTPLRIKVRSDGSAQMLPQDL